MQQAPIPIILATTNPGKVREFQLASDQLSSGLIEFVPLPQWQLEPPEETSQTFRDNAIQKALYYSSQVPGLLIAEDSGIEVEALGWAPGPWSARYAGPNATDQANNEKLLAELGDATNRSARYRCVIALAKDAQLLATFEGQVWGWITRAPRGSHGFGYDPLFFYPPLQATFAELPPEQKLFVSHRGRAIQKLVEYVLQNEKQLRELNQRNQDSHRSMKSRR